jgi:hypothetical protein
MPQRISLLTLSGAISMDLADLPAELLTGLGVPVDDQSPARPPTRGPARSPISVPAISQADPFLSPEQFVQLWREARGERNLQGVIANALPAHEPAAENQADQPLQDGLSADPLAPEKAEEVSRIQQNLRAARKAGPLAMLALAKLMRQVAAWHKKGWDVAADMLNHFLIGRGAPFSLPDNDVSELAVDSYFLNAIINDIDINLPHAMDGRRTTMHQDTAFTRFFAPDNQLFWAFESLRITYEGWIQEIRHPRPHGGVDAQLKYELHIIIWKHYNFDFEWSHLPGFLALEFDAAALLQHCKIAHAFDLSTTFDIRR